MMTRHAPGDLAVALDALHGYLSQGRCSLALGQTGDWIARAVQAARYARPALTAEARQWLQSIGEPATALAGNQIGEIERARWGTIVLVSLPKWPRDTIEALARRLAGWPDDGSRPVILATAEPCLCGRLGARSCECDENTTRRDLIRLGQFCELLGITDSVVVRP